MIIQKTISALWTILVIVPSFIIVSVVIALFSIINSLNYYNFCMIEIPEAYEKLINGSYYLRISVKIGIILGTAILLVIEETKRIKDIKL